VIVHADQGEVLRDVQPAARAVASAPRAISSECTKTALGKGDRLSSRAIAVAPPLGVSRPDTWQLVTGVQAGFGTTLPETDGSPSRHLMSR